MLIGIMGADDPQFLGLICPETAGFNRNVFQ